MSKVRISIRISIYIDKIKFEDQGICVSKVPSYKAYANSGAPNISISQKKKDGFHEAGIFMIEKPFGFMKKVTELIVPILSSNWNEV
jgi:hypothetical protein